MNGRYATEQQRTENDYPRSKAGSPGAQRLTLKGDWEWNLETKRYRWSEAMYRIFKLAPQPSPPRTGTFLNCVHPEDRDMVVRALGKALVGEQPYNIEHRIVWPDGSVRFIHGEAAITFDQGGRPLRMQGTVRDITPLRQTAEAPKK